MNELSKNNFKHFAITSLIGTIISAIVLFYLSFVQVLPQKGIYLYPFLFFAINILVHLILLKGAEKSPEDFINFFLIGTSIKLLIYFAFLIVYLMFISKTNNRSFAGVFFILYAFFTSVEVFSILKHIKTLANSKKEKV
ncbi:MAG: hypothetical protein V4667_00820 [Bacteroidota bacterium]